MYIAVRRFTRHHSDHGRSLILNEGFLVGAARVLRAVT